MGSDCIFSLFHYIYKSVYSANHCQFLVCCNASVYYRNGENRCNIFAGTSIHKKDGKSPNAQTHACIKDLTHGGCIITCDYTKKDRKIEDLDWD